MKRTFKTLVFLLVLLSVNVACANFSEPIPIQTEEIQEPTLPQDDLDSADQQTTLPLEIVNQQDLFVNLYKQVNPGVVAIRNLSSEGGGLGSGFVIDNDGHIITNYHVIEGSTELEIDFPSGFKTRGEVLGTDSDSDIAVIKVDAPADELHPINLGDSNQVAVGQYVIAIGNPYGLDGTMTTGIVSAKGRTLSSLHNAPGGGSFTAGDIIQTDAAINPGNSGGPLINLDGEVIGVNLAIQTNNFDMTGQPINSGIGFAVSINIVKKVVPHLISDGSYDYPYLGIRSLDEITLLNQENLELPQASGVYIIEVNDNSPASDAGLRGGTQSINSSVIDQGGDLIIAIDNVPVRDFNDLITYLMHEKSPGDTVMLTIIRDNSEIELPLTLGKRP